MLKSMIFLLQDTLEFILFAKANGMQFQLLA